jgi:hypothetical protein
MSLVVRYPWTELERGQGFFVPCLDPEAVKEDGLKKAVFLHMFDAHAKVGIRRGLMGVWFYRRPLPPA